MKIKTKLWSEVMVTCAIISIISFIAILNTKQIQESFTIIIVSSLLFVLTLIIRFKIIRSINNSFSKIKEVTHAISKGDYPKYDEKCNCEFSEIGSDINLISKELSDLNKIAVEQQKLASIGNLASSLSHDIRNPLAVIKNGFTYIDIKMKDSMDHKELENLARMKKAMGRITHQIDGMMNFVKTAELKYEKHSLSSLIKKIVDNTVIPDNVKINLPKNDSEVWCDGHKIDVVISNLISNAGHAMNENGSITFRIIDDENIVTIEIEDSGDGIPETVLPKIFEPLFTTKQIGTGLGLSSCKNIIEEHDGKIWVKNNPTTFTIQLPKKPTKIHCFMKKENIEINLQEISPTVS